MTTFVIYALGKTTTNQTNILNSNKNNFHTEAHLCLGVAPETTGVIHLYGQQVAEYVLETLK